MGRWSEIVKYFVEIVAALATVAIAVLTWVYVHYSEKQWEVMSQQATIMATQEADLKQQIADAQAVERASIVILNLRIEDFPRHPVMKFTLKHVGQTTATEITQGWGGYSSGWFKNMKQPYVEAGAYGPGEHETYDWMTKSMPPSKAGFSLAQGETKDFALPMTDVERRINKSIRGKKLPPAMNQMFPAPTFEDVASGRASYYTQIIFTYLDASGKAHPTVDCITYSEHHFVPCYGGHAEQ